MVVVMMTVVMVTRMNDDHHLCLRRIRSCEAKDKDQSEQDSLHD
jgi:hypothetical protein